MSNYDENNQESIADFVLNNLPRHDFFVLATANEDSTPWAVCLHKAYDTDINFIWKSAKSAEHSRNLYKRPDVAICMFSKTPEVGDFGFYCKATAHEVNDEAELSRLLAIRSAGKEIPPTSDLLGESPLRLYYAKVTEAWVTDDRHKKTPVDLEVLRKKAKAG